MDDSKALSRTLRLLSCTEEPVTSIYIHWSGQAVPVGGHWCWCWIIIAQWSQLHGVVLPASALATLVWHLACNVYACIKQPSQTRSGKCVTWSDCDQHTVSKPTLKAVAGLEEECMT